MLSPANLAGVRIQTGQVAIRTQRVQDLALDRRRRASGREAGHLVRLSHVSQTRAPDSFPVAGRDGRHELVLQALVGQQVQTIANHRRRGVTGTDVRRLPDQLRPLLRPSLKQALLLRNAVPVGAAPLGPVGGRHGNRSGDDQGECCQGERNSMREFHGNAPVDRNGFRG